MRRRYVINGQAHDLVVTRGANGVFHVSHGERKFDIQGKALADGRWQVTVDQRSQAVWIAAQGDSRFVHSAATGAIEVEVIDLSAASGGDRAGAASDLLLAPMPGTVIAVHVAVGDAVCVGQPLIVIESMKLETTLTAPRDARVKAVHFSVGNTFALKSTLVTLQDL
jgi:acetyl/propionyl-CoA carboxylase alpha subunit